MNMHTVFRPGFIYEVDVVRRGRIIQAERKHNLLPDQMAAHYNAVAFQGASQVLTWYLAPFEGNYTPQGNETGTTIAALATECTAYDESTRREWVEAGGAALTNSASKAIFTMNAEKTVYGGFLVSAPAKGATTGILASLVKFASPKQLEVGDLLRITAGMAVAN